MRGLFFSHYLYPPPSTSNGDLPVALETVGGGDIVGGGLLVITFPGALDTDGGVVEGSIGGGGGGGEVAGLCTVLFAGVVGAAEGGETGAVIAGDAVGAGVVIVG